MSGHISIAHTIAFVCTVVSGTLFASDFAMTTLTKEKVSDVLDKKDWILVDTRSSNAYNGWKLDGIERGGHIPGAVDFPARWLESDVANRKELLADALRVKRIEPDRHVLVYGTNQRDRIRVAEYLHSRGCRKLYEFDFAEWIFDLSKPLERYENYHLLLPASIVKLLLEGKRPESFEDARRVIFAEVSWGDADASYSKGHVPSSFHVNTDDFEPPPKWKLGDAKVLREFAEKYGFQTDDTVIVSGEDPTACFRLAVVLRYLGIDDVRVLNGGFAAWKAVYPAEMKSNSPPKAPPFTAKIPKRPEVIDDIPRVKSSLPKSRDFALVDTRTWAEFIGETTGYKSHSYKGRIPGSIYGQGDFKGANSLTPYRNIDNTMRNAKEIQAMWKASGIDTKKHLSFMCGGGWRAAEVLTFAQAMGFEKTSLYSDGWIGWSNERNNPIETGCP